MGPKWALPGTGFGPDLGPRMGPSGSHLLDYHEVLLEYRPNPGFQEVLRSSPKGVQVDPEWALFGTLFGTHLACTWPILQTGLRDSWEVPIRQDHRF